MIGLGSVTAQSFKGKINYSPNEFPKIIASSDTLKILAVMVDFQEDNDPNTYGTGKFGSIYTQSYADTILDPLPFDLNYFSNHLEFAKNYFKKVSGGKLNITYNILPQVLTVSQTMRNYSPPPNSSDLTSEGNFAKEVWQLAVHSFPNIDFSQYNLFTIFHAGVGREFSVPGSLGTERDLSSVYLGINSLQKIYGNNFNGFPANGNFQITNTMILPCTESKEIVSNNQKMLLQLTTNGLIVSSIASYLGLPDLFNTSTGTTAIGRFGLMDPESIFGYSGIFPPEPSAWEKIYLGWTQPVTISIKDSKVDIVARLAASLNDTTILKVPINSSEYFLLENRQRDVNKDGINITYKVNGQTNLFKLNEDKGRFQWSGVDSLGGVVTDVDEFDWAVPGNGIVIWHIDENIINAKIANDQINADLNNKGVAVVEADGIDDIGQQFNTVFGVSYGSGDEEDMWFAGNTGHYFINKFSNDTKPNTKSNSGANSYITIENFSAQANRMSFNVLFQNGSSNLLTDVKLPIDSTDYPKVKNLIAIFGYSSPNYFILDGNDLVRLDSNGTFIKRYSQFSSGQRPAAINYNGKQIIIGSFGKTVNIYSKDVSTSTLYSSNNDSIKSIVSPYQISTPIVIYKNNGNLYISAGTIEGNILQASLNSILSSGKIIQDEFQNITNKTIYRIYRPFDDVGYYSFSDTSGVFDDIKGNNLLNIGFKNNILTKDKDGDFINILLSSSASGDHFYIINNLQVTNTFQTALNSVSNFSVADIFHNGQNYILYNNGQYLEAHNYSGAMADHFPFKEPNGDNFTGIPYAIDFNGDGITEVIATSVKGNIYAINPLTGKILDGFPISNGSAIIDLQFFNSGQSTGQSTGFKSCLATIDSKGQLTAWNLSSTLGSSYWSAEYGDIMNTSFVAAPLSTNTISDFFPLNRAYNWPNPVYGTETKIRYFVGETSNIKIKIFDIAGGLVAELSDQALAGFDHETIWNVSNVQSGIYYAHIEVAAQSGKSASKNIKIAVIK
jgi:hypothetical protein